MDQNTFNSVSIKFLEKVFRQLEAKSIHLRPHWSIDHLCYRTESEESYEKNKIIFSNLGELLIESEVNNRLISTFKLFEPIHYHGREIQLLELPAPKKGKPTTEGLEHIEVVCDLALEDLANQYSHLSVQTKGMEKDFNRELEIELDGSAIKFHHLSLESVIHLEENTKVFQALKSSEVLNILSTYSPQIVGTFPLALHQADSDLDILLYADNLFELEACLKKSFSSMNAFKIHPQKVDGIDSLIASFVFDKVPFELFAQNIPTHEQVAFRHFQTEERLLKLGGENFFQSVFKYRQIGLKTEPAFASALNLSGNSYQAISDLFLLSESELKSRYHL